VGGDSGEIRLKQGRDVRRFADRPYHILGDRSPHPVMRNVTAAELARLRGRRLTHGYRCCACNGAVDILTRDPAAPPRTLDPRWIDAVLHACPADRGRKAGFDITVCPELVEGLLLLAWSRGRRQGFDRLRPNGG